MVAPERSSLHVVSGSSSDYSVNITVDGQKFCYFMLSCTASSFESDYGYLPSLDLGQVLREDVPELMIRQHLSDIHDVIAGVDGVELGEQVVRPEYGEDELQQSVWYSPHAWLNGLNEDEDEMYAPVTIPGKFEDLESLTQEQLQLGEVLIEGTVTDTFAPEANPEAVGGYALDLTEFFPFCIPFDLYEFFSLLAADPEAPVFEWIIPVPQIDEEFTLTVDLSAWDSVAKLVRTLELLAFIVGLALLTRDKFLRG